MTPNPTPAELAALESAATPGPYAVSPNPCDDWGLVRAADGYPVAITCVSARYTDEEAAQCRKDKTTPAVVLANAAYIAGCRNLSVASRLVAAEAEVERLRTERDEARNVARELFPMLHHDLHCKYAWRFLENSPWLQEPVE